MQETLYVSSNPGIREKKHAKEFFSITDALSTIPDNNQTPAVIRIAPGIYHEKLTIRKPFVTLEGTGKSSADTILTFDDYAYCIMEDGQKRGTFRSYSVFIDTHDVTLKNLSIENASGDPAVHGQAIALYADGDRLVIDSCRLLSHQDTLFTGPLPPKELEKNGFIGPKQYAPRINGRHYYKNCYICGDIDFIFGSATAFFENCMIESLRHDSSDTKIQGYITAASTPEGQAYGYVFSQCRFLSGECPPGSVYLGRPWRNYAKTVFLHCQFGAHIHPELFHDWNKTAARNTVYYAVCPDDTGRIFSERADFVQVLDHSQAAAFSKENVLSGQDGWLPE